MWTAIAIATVIVACVVLLGISSRRLAFKMYGVQPTWEIIEEAVDRVSSMNTYEINALVEQYIEMGNSKMYQYLKSRFGSYTVDVFGNEKLLEFFFIEEIIADMAE